MHARRGEIAHLPLYERETLLGKCLTKIDWILGCGIVYTWLKLLWIDLRRPLPRTDIVGSGDMALEIFICYLTHIDDDV